MHEPTNLEECCAEVEIVQQTQDLQKAHNLSAHDPITYTPIRVCHASHAMGHDIDHSVQPITMLQAMGHAMGHKPCYGPQAML